MVKKDESEKIVLSKDNIDEISITFDMNFNNTNKNILKRLARDERMINYSILSFKTGNPGIKKFDLFKRFLTIFNILINLIKEKITVNEAKQKRKEMIEKIDKLKSFILLKEESIT